MFGGFQGCPGGLREDQNEVVINIALEVWTERVMYETGVYAINFQGHKAQVRIIFLGGGMRNLGTLGILVEVLMLVKYFRVSLYFSEEEWKGIFINIVLKVYTEEMWNN